MSFKLLFCTSCGDASALSFWFSTQTQVCSEQEQTQPCQELARGWVPHF